MKMTVLEATPRVPFVRPAELAQDDTPDLPCDISAT
jgi:hypothetical protein